MAKENTEKKAVVVIVEGSSDKKALEKIFQKIYKHRNIVFKFTGGDVTSDETINENNVCDIIFQKVKEYMQDKKLNLKDIWQIIHIFDTDGTYVPDSAIEIGDTSKFVYSTTCIMCNDIQKVVDRNQRKSRMMNFLRSVPDIKGISYRCFYMSSNLDHALYDMQNLEDEEKGEYADQFYSEFIGKEELFVDYLRDEVANGVPSSFPASWRYIKEDLHSLERHSNLHIYFDENPY